MPTHMRAQGEKRFREEMLSSPSDADTVGWVLWGPLRGLGRQQLHPVTLCSVGWSQQESAPSLGLDEAVER